MNFERLIRQAVCEAWYIETGAYHAALAAVPAVAHVIRGNGIKIEANMFESRSDWVEEHSATARTQDLNGVRVIPITGVIGMDLSEWEIYGENTDVLEVEALLYAALQDENIGSIVLAMDSPGGTVSGVPELATLIAEISAQKPVVVHTRRLMASAAYFLAAGARAIFATPSAQVGSIGVYLPLLDISGLYEKLGLRVDLIVNEQGTHKAAGYPGTTLTDEQRAGLQMRVDHAFRVFRDHVLTHRSVAEDALTGQVMWGSEGVEPGLIDALATLPEAVQQARVLADAGG